MKPESVTYSFKKCAISNAMGSTEDNLLWEEPALNEPQQELNDNEEEADDGSEIDPYNDQITHEEFLELFGSSDGSEDDFEGFQNSEQFLLKL